MLPSRTLQISAGWNSQPFPVTERPFLATAYYFQKWFENHKLADPDPLLDRGASHDWSLDGSRDWPRFPARASAARAEDEKPAQKKVADIAGVWNSDWGPVTLQTTPSKDGKTLTVRGTYDSSTGKDRTGLIKSGTFDPATGILEFALEEPWWGNDTKGTAKLTLAADGQKLEGPYLKTNKDGGRDEGTVTLTHVRDVVRRRRRDLGLALGHRHPPNRSTPAAKNVSVTGSYNSITGKNRTGLIKSGAYDPATGILEFALEEPWWGNQTKGSARLTLDAAGNRFKGSYTKTNQGGDKDKGEVSLLRLGGSNFAAALDSIFADAGIKADTPGAAVMVIDHGKVVFSKCVGLATLTDKKPITPQTTFDLCSVGKQFTGAAILRLYEQGKLNLDDDIRKFIPEMPVYDANNPIRILDVARMTSGLPDGVMYAEHVEEQAPGLSDERGFRGRIRSAEGQIPAQVPDGPTIMSTAIRATWCLGSSSSVRQSSRTAPS